MIFFVAAIIFGAAIYLLFKYVGVKQLHLPTVVLFNYIICVVIGASGLILKESEIIIHSKIIGASAIMGLLFVSMFYLMGMLTKQAGVATSSLISRVSLVIPALFFYFAWGESLSHWAIVGILLATVSIVLINNVKGKRLELNGALPIIVFIGYGLVDVGLKLSQAAVEKLGNAHHELTLGIFFFAGTYGWVIKLIKGIKLEFRSTKSGVLLGAINYFSIYFFFLALERLSLPATVIFPLNGISIMLVATVLSILLFKESITFKKLLALLLAAISIILMSN